MLPDCVISTFGLRHTMGEPLPVASRGNSGSQPRLNPPVRRNKHPPQPRAVGVGSRWYCMAHTRCSTALFPLEGGNQRTT